MDGSQKLPQRLLGTVRDRLAAGRPIDAPGARGRRLDALRERRRRARDADRGRPIRWPPTFARDRRSAHGGDPPGARRRLPRPRRGVRRRPVGAIRAFARPVTRRGCASLCATARARTRGRTRRKADTGASNSRHRHDPASTSIPTGCSPPIPPTRELARALYATVKDLPIVSPHGHTDPQWFADDAPFADASALFITPDHYVFRMLYSQGIRLEDLGIPRRDGGPVEPDARKIWRTFAAHYHLFRGTPTRIWLDHAFHDGVRHRRAADAGVRRPLLRPHQRCARAAGVPAARAVRALQHRGDRDHRVAARSARPPPEDPRSRAGRAA